MKHKELSGLLETIPSHYYYAGLLYHQSKQFHNIEQQSAEITPSNIRMVIEYAISLYVRDQTILADQELDAIKELQSLSEIDQEKTARLLNKVVEREHILGNEKTFIKYAAIGSACWSLLAGLMFVAVGYVPDARLQQAMGDCAARVTTSVALSVVSLCFGCGVVAKQLSKTRLDCAESYSKNHEGVFSDLQANPINTYLKLKKKQKQQGEKKALRSAYRATVAWQIAYTSAQICLMLFQVSVLSLGPVGIAINMGIGMVTGVTSAAIEYSRQKRLCKLDPTHSFSRSSVTKALATGFLYGMMPGVIGGVCLHLFSGARMVATKIAATAMCSALVTLVANRVQLYLNRSTKTDEPSKTKESPRPISHCIGSFFGARRYEPTITSEYELVACGR